MKQAQICDEQIICQFGRKFKVDAAWCLYTSTLLNIEAVERGAWKSFNRFFHSSTRKNCVYACSGSENMTVTKTMTERKIKVAIIFKLFSRVKIARRKFTSCLLPFNVERVYLSSSSSIMRDAALSWQYAEIEVDIARAAFFCLESPLHGTKNCFSFMKSKNENCEFFDREAKRFKKMTPDCRCKINVTAYPLPFWLLEEITGKGYRWNSGNVS